MFNWVYTTGGGIFIYKKQERALIWLSFIVASILGLSIIGRIVSG
ncbi:hypothetical protein [Neobacillus jeddahensis]|nr:hypothetical protein [Neobacillus jeddahensis]